ncbi:hypothetical protein ABKV19_008835 [Rosa sericea]
MEFEFDHPSNFLGAEESYCNSGMIEMIRKSHSSSRSRLSCHVDFCIVWQIEDFVQLCLMCWGISSSHPVISPSRISSLLFFFIPQLLKSSRSLWNIGKVEAWNLIGCDLFAVG